MCGTAQGSPTSEAGEPECVEEVVGPAEAEAEAVPQVAEVQEAPAAPVAVAAPPAPAAQADGDSDVDEQARMVAAQEVLVGFRPESAIRSAVFGKVNVRSMFVGVYRRTMDLLKWQMRWTRSTFVGLDSMIRLGSVPWIRGTGIVTYSNIWSPKLWYSWPSIERINQAAAHSPEMAKVIAPCESILARIIRRRIVDHLSELLPQIPDAREVNIARFRSTLGPHPRQLPESCYPAAGGSPS